MRRDALLIAEIAEAAERILELTANASLADLEADRSRREALLWSFTVLGEASSQLDPTIKESYPDVPWRAATALRNRIVHSYWQISTRILLATAQDDIPPLLQSIRVVQQSLQDDT